MDLQVVVKVSKHCNLRCTYCYETRWLGQRARMDLGDIGTLFEKVLELASYATSSRPRVQFFWQGGEPFLQPLRYWQEIAVLQQQVFQSSRVSVYNEIQSNGTLIKECHLELLREHFSLGLSFDVDNASRRSANGRDVSDLVVSKLDWLISEGVSLTGVIAVVSKRNIDHLPAVAEFFLSRGLNFRLLNIYTGIDLLSQIEEAAVPIRHYLERCSELVVRPEIRAALDQGFSIEPFTTALRQGAAHRRSKSFPEPEPEAEREWVLLVDTNGDLYSPGFAYEPRNCYGNIFRDTLAGLFFSEGRKRRIAESHRRFDAICSHCFLFRKGCDGRFVAHCTPEEARSFSELRTCYYGWLAGAAENHSSACISA